jgi:hypothetical protein
MRRLIYLGKHGLIFAIAKSSVLFSPLLAAGILSKSQYGSVEWWLALSLSFGPVFAMGAPGLVAYGTLGDKYSRHVSTATVFVLITATALLLLAFVMPVFGLDWHRSLYGPVLVQCAVIALQMTLAARLKGLGKGAWASLVESSLYLSLLCALIVSWKGLDFVNSFICLMLLTSVLLIAGLMCSVSIPRLPRWTKLNYRAFLRASMPFMAGGALMGIFMAMPRISLGFFASPGKVAEFALVFRWLSIAIVAHQFINTVFFRKIFADGDPQRRDRMLAATVFIVAILSVCIVLTLQLTHSLNVPLPIPPTLNLAWSMCIVMFMWSGSASLEGSLYRVGASLVQVRATVFGLTFQLLTLGLITVLGVGEELLFGVTSAWLIGFFVMIYFQWRGLKATGEKVRWLMRVLVALILIPVCTLFLGLAFSYE